MNVETFLRVLGADFYTGVPDSLLKALCNELLHRYPKDPRHHIIAANEGNAAAIAAGYHLATGKTPVVYLQNSGEGNLVNPVASLLHPDVYAIPCIFVVGWRGEPGVHDEPQHVFQGKITRSLLDVLEIPSVVVGKGTTEEELAAARESFDAALAEGRQVAFVIEKGALISERAVAWKNDYILTRERALEILLEYTGDASIVSTTGKASRELYELREKRGDDHSRDFLTVGSMGHASSIALGIALQRTDERVYIVDGDGAALMHMGALTVIGQAQPKNLVHILIDNEAHESVGGFPTAAKNVDFCAVARACGYRTAVEVADERCLRKALFTWQAQNDGPMMLVIRCAIGARKDLGRPKATPQENKQAFMRRGQGE